MTVISVIGHLRRAIYYSLYAAKNEQLNCCSIVAYRVEQCLSNGALVAHLSERAPFTSADVGSIPVGNDL